MTRKSENSGKEFIVLFFGIALIFLCVSSLFAQSTNLEFPTPITSDRISGKIRARDLGDSRLTSHYFIFESGTGDVLLNIESLNLNGDIDVYTAGSLKPLLKASVYAVGYATVMQRQIYLRIPSRLILRVEGRTPNDDPADYKISFGGVFKPVAASAVPRNPGDPKVSGSETTEGARAIVSSVGTIIEEIKPPPPVEEPKPEPKKEAAKGEPKTPPGAAVAKSKAKDKPQAPPVTPGAKPKTHQVVITPLPKPADKKAPETKKTDTTAKTEKAKPPAKSPVKPEAKPESKPKSPDTKPKNAAAGAKTTSSPPKKPDTAAATKLKAPPRPAEATPEQLADIFLVVIMKEGDPLRYSMADVQRVNVDKGILTITLKNGGIARVSLLDVEEIKIQ